MTSREASENISHLIDASTHIIAAIDSTIHKINNTSAVISETVQFHNEGTQDIYNNMNEINTATQNVVENIKILNHSSTDTSVSANQVLQSLVSLRLGLKVLKENISQFVVKFSKKALIS